MEIPIPRAGSSQPKPSRGSSGLAEELNPNQLQGIFRVFPESGCEQGWWNLCQKGQMDQEKSLGMPVLCPKMMPREQQEAAQAECWI